MNKNSKKIISIDLDGVLNNYNGDYKKDFIPSIRFGAYEFIENLSKYFRIEIYTVRDELLVKNWLKNNDLEKYIFNITNIKNKFSSIFLDDRAINFNGNYEETFNKIINFKPYWK